MRCKARPGILLSTSAWFEQFVVILAYVANGKIIRGKGMLAGRRLSFGARLRTLMPYFIL